jgi:methylmalonyl-CoA/ethylmalonyl-CoA epimerase
MPEMRLDHISFLVRDLDAAVEKWKKLLGILDPRQAERITWGGGVDGFLRKILDRRGEHVHHVAFLSSDVDTTVEQLREAGVPIVQEENTAPDTMPWLKWNFVPPDYVGGVLVEVAQRYNVEGDEWVPVPGDPS